LYIALTSSAGRNARNPQQLIRLDETVTRRMDDTGILRLRDIDRIIWINLERIDAHIYADIENTVTSDQYDWAKGYTPEDRGRLARDERKLLFYLAARRAGEANYELLAQHRALATEALEFWHEYWQRVMTPLAMDRERVQRALHVLESPHFRPEIPIWSAVCNLPEDHDANRLVTSVLQGDAPFTSDQVVDALRAGKLAYEAMPNITPVTLLTVRLPIVDPTNTSTYLWEADRALSMFRLNRAWYSCVENHRAFNDENLEFYMRIRQELTQRS